VSLTSSFDTKEQVRQATDIVDLVGEAVPLQRQGRIYKGLCPWHDDTRPSFQVNPERQTFRCWVCDVGGDAFSFVMRRDNVEFGEALEILADRAGIDIRRGRGSGESQQAARDDKRTLYRAHDWAADLFHKLLLSDPRAQLARDYLQDRGINQESIERHRVGFSPNEWTWLVEQVRSSEFSVDHLERLGLVGVSQKSGRHYDRFKGRVLFPIRDVQKRTIAVGGRILPHFADDQSAKYINSPETPLFSKSSQLYGLDLAREALGKKREVIVTEGYTDCVVARQFGFDNTVAVLGTALGEKHVKLLSRFADRVTLVLDGDAAGQRRANEILDLFLAGQLDLRVLTLPDGLDPCDFLFQRGAEAFDTAIREAVDALEHKLRLETGTIDPASGTFEANQALESVLSTVAKAPRGTSITDSEMRLREDQFLARVARRFGVEESNIRTRVETLRAEASRRTSSFVSTRNAPRRNTAAPDGGVPVSEMGFPISDDGVPMSDMGAPAGGEYLPPVSAADTDRWERELLEIVIQDPETIPKAAESITPDQLQDRHLRRIYAKCCELQTAGISPELDRLLLEFEDPAVQVMLVDLDEAGRDRGGSDLAGQLPDVLTSLQRRREQREQRQVTAALKEDRFGQEEQVQHLEEMFRQLRHRQGISEPTDE